MSILHSPRAPWLMLVLFCIAALVFFMLAAGQDLGLLPEAASTREKGSVVGEIRRAITRGEERIVEKEKEIAHKTGEILEHAGKKLSDWAGVHPAETDPLPTPAPAPSTMVRPMPEMPSPDTPGSFISHDFSRTDQGFRAAFVTNRPIPDPKVFFIADPARWVVDVPGQWRNAARFNNPIAEGAISRVVLGEHESYLRVVFHFRDTTRPRPDHSPRISKQDKGFIVLVPGN